MNKIFQNVILKNLTKKSSVILTAALIVSGFFAFTALANTHTTAVNIDPQYVAGGVVNPYTFTITNNGTDSIYKITINIPILPGFLIDTSSISCPTDWTKDASSNSFKAVCITDPFGGDILISGNSADVSFDAISPTPGSDTEYTWSVVTKDQNAGYEFTNTDAKTTVDVTSPITTDDAPAGWQTTSPIFVNLTCTDESSGCDTTYYCVDQTDECFPNIEGTSVSVSDEGINYVRYYSEDNVGNQEDARTAEVWIDTNPPIGTILINDGDTYTNSVGVNLTLTYEDPGTSGVEACRYQNEGEEWTEWEGCIDTREWTLAEGSGEKIVYYEVRDVAGNVGDNADTIILDTISPVVGLITVDPTIIGSGPYTNSNPTLSAGITDDGSGVAYCEYQLVTEGPWYEASWDGNTCTANPIKLSDGQTYQFNIKGIDNAENEGVGIAEERTVDATAPTISNPGVAPIAYSTPGPETDYVKGTITVFANISDEVSGVDTVEFDVGLKSCSGVEEDENYWSCQIDTTDPLPDGEYTLVVTATDNAGNEATDDFYYFIIDNTPPTTTKTVGDPKYGEDEYVTTNTQITLTANDGGGGVGIVCYQINDETPVCSEAGTDTIDFSFSEESQYTLIFWAVDVLGNTEETQTQTHYVDDSPPVTTKSYGIPFYTDEIYKWITSDTEITLTANDAEPHPVGVRETQYRVSGTLGDRFCQPDVCASWMTAMRPNIGPWNTYLNPFTISDESCHVIEYRSIDNLGNTEDIKWQCMFVDNTPPVLAKEVGKPKFPPIEFQTIGNGTAGWTDLEKYFGDYSVRLYVLNGSNDISAVEFDVDIALDQITELSFWQNIANTYGVNVILGIDTDDDGVYESQDKPWHFSHDPADLGDDSFIEMDGMSPSSGTWEEVNTLAINQWWTPDNAGNGFCPEFGWNSLSDIQTISRCRVDPTDHVKVIKLLIGGSGSWMDKVAYIDDITLNEKTIVLEPRDFWITQSTPITLTCSDPEPHPSDNVKIWYRYNVDGGAWTGWIDPVGGYKEIRFTEDSLHTLEYYCEDALGNQTETYSQTYKVDTASPVTTKTYDGPYYTNGSEEWITSQTAISLNAVDPEPHPVGVDKTQYRVSGALADKFCNQCANWMTALRPNIGPWNTYLNPFTISGESCHVIEYRSIDKLGNEEEINWQCAFVDNTPPTAEIRDVADTTYEDYYVKGTIDVIGTATDNKCLVGYALEYCQGEEEEKICNPISSDGEIENSSLGLWDTTQIEDGEYYLALTVEDCVGYTADSFFDVFVDNTPPTSQTDSAETVTAEPNQVQVDFSAYWSGTDNDGSGIADYDLWVKDGENSWAAWTPGYWGCDGGYCAEYLGTIGHRYCFKSRTADYLENYEPDKDVGDEGVSCTDVAAYTFDIDLIQGWNLISLPVVPLDKDSADVLKDIALSTKGVWAYDPLDSNAIDGWLSYAPDVPSNLNIMTAGFGYWIEMSNAETLTVAGTIMPVGGGATPPQRKLIPGWDLIGHYGVDEKEAQCALYPLWNNDRWVQPLWGYQSGSFFQVYEEDSMTPGNGYWMAISSALPENVVYTMSECSNQW